MAISTALEHSLASLGNVPSSYRHEWRVAKAYEPLVLPDAVFSWYQVHREGVPVSDALDAEARGVVTDAMANTSWDPSYGLNFSLLHVSTAGAFLIAGVWRGHQELWERIYAKDLATDSPFTRVVAGEDGPVGCVWEMAVICHERMAWHRYLFTERSEVDKLAWLTDLYSGSA